MSNDTTYTTVVRPLLCQLTTVERNLRAAALADAIESKESAKDRHAAARRAMKDELEEIEGRIHALSKCVGSGAESRQVEVECVKDLDEGTYRETRTDTGEVVEERPLTTEERQMEI